MNWSVFYGILIPFLGTDVYKRQYPACNAGGGGSASSGWKK